jgi:Flp pilus assembly protein TadB
VIGLWAAVALFGGAIWLLLDELYVRRGRQQRSPRPRRQFRQLRLALAEADLNLSPRQLVLASGSGALVVFVMVYQLMDWLVPSLFAAGAAAATPLLYVWWRRENRLDRKEEALIVALERVQEELRTVGIQEALVSLETTAPEAVRPIFQRLAADLAQQRDYADALRASKVRLGSQIWDDAVAGLLLAHTVGERNIRGVFKRVTDNARAQVQLRQRVRSQQAEQITSARITLIVPIAVVLFMRFAYPAADTFYSDVTGEILLLACGAVMLCGYVWMLRIGRIARAPRVDEEIP